GTRRIGVAVSDLTGTLASPHSMIPRSGDAAADHRRVADVLAEVEAQLVVVGLPLSMSGAHGPAAQAAEEEATAMAEALSVPVVTHDERLTTVTAERVLRANGVKGQARRRVVDQTAAAVMLQSWLDGRLARGSDQGSDR
ncbi:MAG: Holliday junction resolvase RuvX, partial [Acidimicrobiales bacterium]